MNVQPEVNRSSWKIEIDRNNMLIQFDTNKFNDVIKRWQVNKKEEESILNLNWIDF